MLSRCLRRYAADIFIDTLLISRVSLPLLFIPALLLMHIVAAIISPPLSLFVLYAMLRDAHFTPR